MSAAKARGPTRFMAISYAIVAFSLVSLELPLNVTVPEFYIDVVGVDVGAAAFVLLVARVWDAVNDPLLGWLSDATRTRWGRRRPWMLAGCVPLALSMILLLTPPALSTSAAAAAYMLAILLATDLFWTAVSVPYDALGIEMTSTYDERTRLLGLRDGVAIVGVTAAVALPAALAHFLHLPPTPEGTRRKLALFAAIYAPLIVATSAWCALFARERPLPEGRARAAPLAARLRGVAKNGPFWTILASFTIGGIATQLPVTLHVLVVRYVVRAERPDVFMPLFVGAAIVALPLWLFAAQRSEKRTVYAAALTLSAAAQALSLAVGPGDTALFGALTVLSGAPLGALVAMPSSMQGDVIDLGAAQGGGRRDEGLYIGIWSIARKLAGAGGASLGLFVLSRAGFVANSEQAPRVVTSLRLLYSVVPAGLSLLAAVALARYPIDRAAHAAIMRGEAGSKDRS